ncbi:CaiB/BaiF CoA transferase family protein [Rhabdothermincola sediminis]|uniref:CaiB/BaiF CoA transferase family protein n=1 Tax=Rhabdothermincola sediminis TaxID=2751370 RepID=UPI001AA06E8D|nr:CoA transferase [Rhabdothermincola sediminis]
MTSPRPPLAGVRIIECSLLGPAAITTHLADLGAEVVKVESPTGDYVREMTWPIVEGTSLMHLHINRGKRSIVLDLKSEPGAETFRDLVRSADAVVEAMRPGVLDKLGLGYERLLGVNPRIVFCTISGYGMTGPYKNLPSHGIAYDTWAGIVDPAYDEDGFCYIPDHVSIGINAAPLYGALGILAGILRARETGEGCRMELAQSDAAAAFDWYRSETYKAYERPESEVTGNKSDNYERRAPGIAGMRGGVRYQLYESADGHVLFMASEQVFWKNFCQGVGRMDLFERWPGSQYADHARHNRELQAELREIFKSRTSAEWIAFADEHNTTIAPVNTPQTIAQDPQFQDRLGWIPREVLGAEELPFPVKLVGEELPVPTRAPELGEHSDQVLRELLGYDDDRIAALRAAGAFGS